MINKPLSETSEWTFELIEKYHKEIARIAGNFGLDTYPVQLEIITAEQMMDAYAAVGMPIVYSHWSFGKEFVTNEARYKKGQMGLAYEIVINSNPCIAYLMEENSMTMQALVIAHAAYGHNSFFKNNYLFTTWTSADSIIDYLVFAKNYIAQCEERYGEKQVEEILDSCHALRNYGVDRYKRPSRLSLQDEETRQKAREEYLQSQVNELWRTIPVKAVTPSDKKDFQFPKEPQENILYFLEKNSPFLEPWQREIIRIVRKIAQYFYPQRQTQVMNEGWATFWHYTLLNQLYDEGLVTDGFMIEFLQSHTNVIYQPPFHSKHYSGINPYALGFAMMSDIRRICEDPTDEDRRWFPDIAGSDWNKTLHFAMQNFKDESFIGQYLSPKVIRDFKLFSIFDDYERSEIEVTSIHNDSGYQYVRHVLSEQYNLGSNEPNIQIYDVDLKGDRTLTLRHTQYHRMPLDKSINEVLK
ncbi:MAG: SpoVR family protein, partial [Methylosarcina sp.]